MCKGREISLLYINILIGDQGTLTPVGAQGGSMEPP